MRIIIAIASVLLTFSINADEPPRLNEVKLIDLSHTYDDKTLFWPTSPIKFEHPELSYGPSGNGYFYSAYTFATAEHGGTHLDAPIHFFESGQTVDALDLNDLMLPVNVIDVTDKTTANRDYLLQVSDIEAFEKEYGKIEKGTAVLLRTGWSKHWPDAKAYMGDDTPGDTSKLSFPSFGVEAAKLLVARGIKLLGIDTASTDGGKSTTFDVHVVISSANIPAIENMNNLEALPQQGAYIMALPMKIGDGSGAPVRVVGMIKK
ncbi:cyclase family protein [Kordiimonas aquimaris]|uniref:cyclase family protein n=1 Tax=Kordiimonas aquimaris TaxID=707591 RepID=UPI0021D081E4|nr:cyclase family protein [Kordiimonas aquimaris]